MKRLQHVMQINIYLLVILASGMLTAAEGFEDSFPPQALSIPLAIAAFFLVERWQQWVIPNWLVNVLGVAAVLLSIREFSGGGEGRLTSGAHFIVMLTWITLFLRKSSREYWWLCALSTLQVAVGAVLTNSGLYGGFLILFLGLSVWTLSVASLYRSRQRFDRAETVVREKLSALEAGVTLPAVSKGHTVDSARRQQDGGVAAAAAALTGALHQQGTAVGSVQRDPSAHWLSRRFVINNLGTSLLSLLFAFVLFLSVPRAPEIWGSGRSRLDDSGSRGSRPMTGFTRAVQLGDLGQILESTRRVVEVRVVENDSERSIDLYRFAGQMGYDEPYLRGSVMKTYADGAWQTESDKNQMTEFGNEQLIDDQLPSGWYRQEYRLQPIDDELLFTLFPVFVAKIDGEKQAHTWIDRSTMMLRRPKKLTGSRSVVAYSTYTPPGSQPEPVVRWRYSRYRIREERIAQNYLEVPDRGLDGLITLARETAEWAPTESPLDAVTARRRADRLLDYLSSTGGFSYSLNATIVDPAIDPLEDFVVNRRTGHCEYFASALTLMLRAVDIPARMVSGFKGAEENTVSGYYEVQERHAHAWVEAFIDGQWLTLDPTPANERQAEVVRAGSQVGRWQKFSLSIRDFWNRYVVNLNILQQRSLLAPFKSLAASVWNMLKNGRQTAANAWANLKRFLSSPQRWFSWEGGLFSFVFLLFLAGVWWVSRGCWRAIRRYRNRRNTSLAKQSRTVVFYERFIALCRNHGLERGVTQTQAEFFEQVQQTLCRRFPCITRESFPQALVKGFYRVRFGHHELDSHTLDEIEHQLTTFQQSLQQAAQTS